MVLRVHSYARQHGKTDKEVVGSNAMGLPEALKLPAADRREEAEATVGREARRSIVDHPPVEDNEVDFCVGEPELIDQVSDRGPVRHVDVEWGRRRHAVDCGGKGGEQPDLNPHFSPRLWRSDHPRSASGPPSRSSGQSTTCRGAACRRGRGRGERRRAPVYRAWRSGR